MLRWINGDAYRILVLTILGGLAVGAVAFSNRDVYSKEQVDTKLEGVERELNFIQQDVRWLVRNQGGTPHAETGEDSNTP